MCIQARALKQPCMLSVLKIVLGETEIDENTFHKLQIEKLQSQSSTHKFSCTSRN